LLALLAKCKPLRGTPFDPFGYSAERRLERRLIADYEKTLDQLLGELTPRNRMLAVAIASVPEKIRGFGPIKAQAVKAASAEQAALLARFRHAGEPAMPAAAE